MRWDVQGSVGRDARSPQTKRKPRSQHYAKAEGISLRLRRRPHDLVTVLLVAMRFLAYLDGDERTNGLSGTATATPAARLNAVFLKVSEISMTRSGEQVHSAAAIVLRSLVLVANDHSNWRTQGDAKFRPRLDFDAVLFISRGREGALARASPGHLRLDVVLCEFHSGRAPIDNTADGAAVRFTIAKVKFEMSAQ